MIPAGYMAKSVAARPDWLNAPLVSTIYSLGACMSRNFANYIPYWKHNGYWLFESPTIIREVAREHGIDLAGMSLFFYEVYPRQFDGGAWVPFEPEYSFGTLVQVPEAMVLEGFDVVTFSCQTSPECSPLSCNGLASRIETNSRCLLPSLKDACALLEDGAFHHAEPGPYRVFAVYSVPWPSPPDSTKGD